MARQKTKFEDRFKVGGDKAGSREAALFGDSELEATPEFKAMHLLMDQIDELTDVVNANDAASGSYANLKKAYTTDSGSFSTRISINDAKTGISSEQSDAITVNSAKGDTKTDLAPGTNGGVLTAAVSENRGVYTLIFTFKTSDGRTTKTAKMTMS